MSIIGSIGGFFESAGDLAFGRSQVSKLQKQGVELQGKINENEFEYQNQINKNRLLNAQIEGVEANNAAIREGTRLNTFQTIMMTPTASISKDVNAQFDGQEGRQNELITIAVIGGLLIIGFLVYQNFGKK